MEVLAVPVVGSPKSHSHPLIVPVVLLVLISVKVTAFPWQAAPWIKSAVGLGSTVTTRMSWWVQLSLFCTVRITLKVPDCVYRWTTSAGVGKAIVWVIPSPKFQVHFTTKPEAEVLISAKLTESPWQVGLEKPKLATGSGAMTMDLLRVLLQPAVSVT